MKHGKLFLSLALAVSMGLVCVTGCAQQDGGAESTPSSEATEAAVTETEDQDNTKAEESAEAEETAETVEFSYSDGLDENGYWEGITASDYVKLGDYQEITIPKDTYEISDEEVQSQMESLFSYNTTTEENTERAVVDGDTVNIDYIGRIDGVEFTGGNTDGAGTEVTIGVTSYIDDFLEQLIGHKPGETFDVEVTFPDDYQQEDLQGKDAVFETTINYVADTVEPEQTDEYVAENFSEDYGWNTMQEMEEGIAAKLQDEAIRSYIQTYLATEVPVSSIPDEILEYQDKALVDYYTQTAAGYGVELEEFLTTYMELGSVDELIESNKEYNEEGASYYLVSQAIAEDAGITASDEDLTNYFLEYYGTDDYMDYESQYGLPYLKQLVLSQKVLDYMMDHAVLE